MQYGITQTQNPLAKLLKPGKTQEKERYARANATGKVLVNHTGGLDKSSIQSPEHLATPISIDDTSDTAMNEQAIDDRMLQKILRTVLDELGRTTDNLEWLRSQRPPASSSP